MHKANHGAHAATFNVGIDDDKVQVDNQMVLAVNKGDSVVFAKVTTSSATKVYIDDDDVGHDFPFTHTIPTSVNSGTIYLVYNDLGTDTLGKRLVARIRVH